MSTSVSANINWPLVAGLGITAAVIFYALNIVNNQLGQADALLGGAATDVQNAVQSVQSVISAPASIWQSITGFFSGAGDESTGDN